MRNRDLPPEMDDSMFAVVCVSIRNQGQTVDGKLVLDMSVSRRRNRVVFLKRGGALCDLNRVALAPRQHDWYKDGNCGMKLR
jgi:hypothetical protein